MVRKSVFAEIRLLARLASSLERSTGFRSRSVSFAGKDFFGKDFRRKRREGGDTALEVVPTSSPQSVPPFNSKEERLELGNLLPVTLHVRAL
jgi:hypothetical protein